MHQAPPYQHYILLALGILPLWWAFSFMHEQTDSESFVNAIFLWADGVGEEDRLYRLTKPFALLLPSFLYKLGMTPSVGLQLQQILCSYLAAIFLYKITYHLSLKRHIAFGIALAWLLAQPVAVYGLAVLTDSVGWMVGIAGIYYTLKWVRPNTFNLRQGIIWGIGIGCGVMAKESAIIAGVYLFWHLLVHPFWWSDRLKWGITIGASFIMTIVLTSIYTQTQFGYTLIDWIHFNHHDPVQYPSWWKAFLLQSIRTIDNYVVLTLLGIILLFKQERMRDYLPFLLSGLICWAIYPLVWAYMMDRILFMISPFFIILIIPSYRLFQRFWLTLIIGGGIAQVTATYLIYNHQQDGLLIPMYGIFVLICGLFITLKNLYQHENHIRSTP